MVAIVKHSIAIVGSRVYTNYERFSVTMERILKEKYCSDFVSGGAPGVDSMAEKFAREAGIPIEVIRPNYDTCVKPHEFKYACLQRNTKIVDRCDELVAFWDGVSHGTRDSILKAVQSGKVVTIYSTVRDTK